MKKKILFRLLFITFIAVLVTGCGSGAGKYENYHTINNNNYELKVGIIDGWYNVKNSWAEKNNDTISKMWIADNPEADPGTTTAVKANHFSILLENFTDGVVVYSDKAEVLNSIERKLKDKSNIAYTEKMITKTINGNEVNYVIFADKEDIAKEGSIFGYITIEARIFMDDGNYIRLDGMLYPDKYAKDSIEKLLEDIVKAFDIKKK